MLNLTQLTPPTSALIIEDDPKLADIFEIALQRIGVETEIAPDGQLALNRLAVSSPDLVILDIHLPHVSGVEILRQIRKDDRLKATRVVIVTADVTYVRTMQSEVDMIMTKPVGFREFVNGVYASLGYH
ncbi:MAG: response regulator [Anaerolineae bacterium]|nr:response regulator [Anaerolineae bacterium]